MSTLTIIDNEYAPLMYHLDKKIVHHMLHQTVQGEVFRNILNEGLEVFKKYEAPNGCRMTERTQPCLTRTLPGLRPTGFQECWKLVGSIGRWYGRQRPWRCST